MKLVEKRSSLSPSLAGAFHAMRIVTLLQPDIFSQLNSTPAQLFSLSHAPVTLNGRRLGLSGGRTLIFARRERREVMDGGKFIERRPR